MQDTNFCSRSFFSWTFSYTDGKNTKYIKHVTETKKKPAWSWRHHLRPTRETKIVVYHYRYIQWKSTWKRTFKMKRHLLQLALQSLIVLQQMAMTKLPWNMQIAKQNLNEVVVDVLCQLKVLKTHEIFILKEKIHASIRSLVKFWCWASKLSFSLDIQKKYKCKWNMKFNSYRQETAFNL